MKSKSQKISLIDLVNKRGWNPDLIPIYLDNFKVNFDLIKVIQVENMLSKQGIIFKTANNILKEYVKSK